MMALIGIAAVALGVIVGWFAGQAPARVGRRSRWTSREMRPTVIVTWLLCAAGSGILAIAGARALAGASQYAQLVNDDLGELGLRVDRLSGVFLVITFAVALPVVVAALASGHERRPRMASAVALVLLCTAIVICADNLFLLLAAWEGLGFSFYLLVGYDRDRPGRGAASLLAIGFSKVSGAALLLGGLILAAQSHTFALQGLADGTHGWPRDLAYALLVFAFVAKAGLVPLHLWLPPAYAATPGPARAVLAGVAVNVAFYGLWRTLDVVGAPAPWLAAVVLVVAGVSAILGISHAAVHAKLLELIGWSSVENAGLILSGYGVALVGAATDEKMMTAAGLVAATAQVCAHALGKSLLFTAASDIEDTLGTTDLDRLRGVIFVRPAAGVGLAVGSFTLAGLPLTAGFASEWLTLEALMQQFRLHNLALELSTAVAAVLVALTIGVAGIAFVRLVALTVFGRPSTPLAAPSTHAPQVLPAAAMLVLGAACLGTALLAPLEVDMIAEGVRPIVGGAAFSADAGQWILQPVYPGFSALSPTLLWIVLPSFIALLMAMTLLFSGRRFFAVRRVPPWTSASRGVPGVRGYTSFGYAHAIRKVLAALLRTRHELRSEEQADVTITNAPGAREARLGYVVDVADVVERYVYRPLIPLARSTVHAAKRLQSGRLDAYMAYMLVALVAVVAVVTALGGG
ncbi:proton-conducting transporter membrane subunit [Microbacterium sp. STN6]|uniref:proton-conducting transporter transmembrane domain-containing protein n=1 Tax=Microbacterium sp. STN6 TaxID=2995588 RepID=UPI002260EB69|nr:proton-conducting transporter membrane subunit [Microbacterium sp. STN6]MCX7520867.1 proton-conducting transporter membrane subunit [Microbacterium sp. STN6]